jgi:hypothetical protein
MKVLNMNPDCPFPLLATPPPDGDEIVYANGIFADTGLPLCQMGVAELADIAAGQAIPRAEPQQARARFADATEAHLGAVGDVWKTCELVHVGRSLRDRKSASRRDATT